MIIQLYLVLVREHFKLYTQIWPLTVIEELKKLECPSLEEGDQHGEGSRNQAIGTVTERGRHEQSA